MTNNREGLFFHDASELEQQIVYLANNRDVLTAYSANIKMKTWEEHWKVVAWKKIQAPYSRSVLFYFVSCCIVALLALLVYLKLS